MIPRALSSATVTRASARLLPLCQPTSPAVITPQLVSLLCPVSASGPASSAPMSTFTWAAPTEDDSNLRDVEKVFNAGMVQHHTANTAYPIDHVRTIKPYRVPRKRAQKEIRETLQGAYDMDTMSLYVHVPFCFTRCQFCEYTVVDPKKGRRDDVQDVYFDALMKEMDMYQHLLDTPSKTLNGFDIGGGTPSMASSRNIGRVMDKARSMYNLPDDVVVSIETTPKIAANEPEKIAEYYKMGIRRISYGVQTTDFSMAKKLGRDDGDYLARSVENIRNAGFDSFNLDLMYGFPLRSGAVDKWPATVYEAVNMNPDHITLYRMRYKGTRMAHLQNRVTLKQVNQQEAVARAILEHSGFQGWTGKNTYSRTPESSGCSDYLDTRVRRGTPYIGLGLGAQSLSHHTLGFNLGAVTKKMGQYVRSIELDRIPLQDLYHLSRPQAQGKMGAVSMYYGGIDRHHFQRCFGETLEEAKPREVAFLLERGLMEYTDDKKRLQMTSAGKRHFGGVVSLFYAPSVQGVVEDLPGGQAHALEDAAVVPEIDFKPVHNPVKPTHTAAVEPAFASATAGL